MNTDEHELLSRYLDDALSLDEGVRLQTLLRDNADARRMLRDLATVDAKLTELAAACPEKVELLKPNGIAASSSRKRGPFSWRSVSEIALGLLVGIVFSSVAWAYAVPRWIDGPARSLFLIDEGFEASDAPLAMGLPTTSDVWSGDFTEVTAARNGIQPTSGEKMLRLLRADYEGKPEPEGSYSGDLFRLIDVRSHRREIADGTVRVQLSAAFNAEPFPEAEEFGSSIAVHAITAEMAFNAAALSGPKLADGSSAMVRQRSPRLDRDPNTWQRLEGELLLPPDTEFLLVHLAVTHVPKFQKRVTFEGHYLDEVRLTLSHRRSST